MPKLNVSRSIEINAPQSKVFEVLSDYHHWRPWSPWLIQEPEATNTVSEDGKFNEWEGRRAGTGNMKIIEEKSNEFLKMDLTFLKPWKSEAMVEFHLQPTEDGTRVLWKMDSSLPFFLFWMKSLMQELIGMDYDRGLNMLKEYVEEGKVHSKLEFVGFNEFPGYTYVGIRSSAPMNQMDVSMGRDFGKLHQINEQHKDLISGVPFSIYHKWGIKDNQVQYTAGLPLKSVPDQLGSEFISGSIPATKVYTLRHIGPYTHLGNAWSTMESLKRSKDFKVKRGLHPFETYENDPQDVDEKDLIVDIHFPVR